MGRWIILVIEGKIDSAEPSLREHNQLGNGMPSDSDVIHQILRTSLFLETSMQEQGNKACPRAANEASLHHGSLILYRPMLWIEKDLKAFISLPKSDSYELERRQEPHEPI